MEISRQKQGDILFLRLNGRMDANWCGHVQNALSAAVRDGEHRVHVDMAEVHYISSAGLRVLLTFYKQLRAISGLFGVANPSSEVRSVLQLSGLELLIAPEVLVVAAAEDSGRPHLSKGARFEVFTATSDSTAGMRVVPIGNAGVLASGSGNPTAEPLKYGENAFAIGVGALGASFTDSAARFGEFLAVAGVAAFQPADGSSRPDFVVSEGSLVPEGHLILGLAGNGSFPFLARFEASAEARTVGLTELAQTALELSGASAAVVVGITETSGLVGATLRQSPALTADAGSTTCGVVSPLGPRFGFPQIRDWLSYTSERAFRDSTSLVAGVVARPGSPLDPLLRPLCKSTDLLGHFHAAAFPYRPLRKGRIDLKSSVTELFDGQALQAVLHLLSDSRDFNGAGESEFFRGALWIAPITDTSITS